MEKQYPITRSALWTGLAFIFFLGLVTGRASAQGLIVNGEGIADLIWTAPTEYDVIGTNPPQSLPITDIAGYVLFWHDASRFEFDGVTLRPGCAAKPVGSRNDASCYPNVVDITDGTATTRQLSFVLSTDVTLSFAIVAHTINGLWSDYSNELDKTFTLIVDSSPGAPVLQSVDLVITCTTNLPNVTCDFVVQ